MLEQEIGIFGGFRVETVLTGEWRRLATSLSKETDSDLTFNLKLIADTAPPKLTGQLGSC